MQLKLHLLLLKLLYKKLYVVNICVLNVSSGVQANG